MRILMYFSTILLSISCTVQAEIPFFRRFFNRQDNEWKGEEIEQDIGLCSQMEGQVSPEDIGEGCWSGCQQRCKDQTLSDMYQQDYIMQVVPHRLRKCINREGNMGTRVLCRPKYVPGEGRQAHITEHRQYVQAYQTPQQARVPIAYGVQPAQAYGGHIAAVPQEAGMAHPLMNQRMTAAPLPIPLQAASTATPNSILAIVSLMLIGIGIEHRII